MTSAVARISAAIGEETPTWSRGEKERGLTTALLLPAGVLLASVCVVAYVYVWWCTGEHPANVGLAAGLVVFG